MSRDKQALDGAEPTAVSDEGVADVQQSWSTWWSPAVASQLPQVSEQPNPGGMRGPLNSAAVVSFSGWLCSTQHLASSSAVSSLPAPAPLPSARA